MIYIKEVANLQRFDIALTSKRLEIASSMLSFMNLHDAVVPPLSYIAFGPVLTSSNTNLRFVAVKTKTGGSITQVHR